MSARRRRTPPGGEDSLELLLDTICNVFGAIILVALLVVLQTQVTVTEVRNTSAADPEVQRLELELATAERERDSLEAAVAAISTTITDVERSLAMVGRRSEFLDAIDAARARLERERDLSEEFDQGVRAAVAQVEAMSDRARRLGKDIEAENARAGAVPEAFRRDVRLPIWHDQVAPLQRSILIDGRRAYALPEDCHEERLSVLTSRFRPREGGGLSVLDEASSRAAVSALMAEQAPTRYFVSFWVSDLDESFETFQRLRAAATAMTFEYTVRAYGRGEGLVVRRGGAPRAE